MGRVKAQKLNAIFFKYLISFCFLVLLLLGIIMGSAYGLIEKGVILPANYAQIKIEKLKEQDLEKINFDKEIIPYPCKWGFFNEKGFIDGTLNKEQLINATKYIEGKNSGKFSNGIFNQDLYVKIKFKDGVCVVFFNIETHYKNPTLDKIIPRNLGIITFFIGFILIGIILGKRFSKKVEKEILKIEVVSEKIKMKELEFNIEEGKIKEFNEAFQSIESMRADLKKSLETQWKMEENQKLQIGALAHDIKTPLTIIKGNAELLNEENLERDESLEYILRNTEKIEKYLEILVQVSKENIVTEKEKINMESFLKVIEKDLEMITKNKDLKYKFLKGSLPSYIYGDRIELIRAIDNLISNAADYSNKGDCVTFEAKEMNGELVFIVEDMGRGFSKEELEKATDKFYMGRKERMAGKHYGLGFYIVEKIAKAHGGKIKLENNIGGKVSIFIKNR